ncbi:MAG: 5-formyltetrahydrofolate cyclo-ligase, partial [Pseudomonadota bacterium]
PALAIAGMMGFKLAMPAIHQPGHALEFRHWKAGDPCIQGAFGTLEPAPSAPPAIPDLLLIPLLAFDASCHRLGYGGGFYDRTLEALRAQKACLAIGYAHRVQYEDTIPVDAFDQPLDHVMCEDGLQSGLGLG